MLGGECFCVRGEGRWFQGRRLGTNAIGGEFCVCLVEKFFVCEAKEGCFREGGLVQMPWVESHHLSLAAGLAGGKHSQLLYCFFKVLL